MRKFSTESNIVLAVGVLCNASMVDGYIGMYRGYTGMCRLKGLGLRVQGASFLRLLLILQEEWRIKWTVRWTN